MDRLSRVSSAASPYALTLLRVTVGVIMVVHGWSKLTGYAEWSGTLESMGLPLAEVLAPLAIAGELGGGLGLILGALTPIAAAGVLTTMLVAIFTVHIDHGLLAENGGFEYPLTLAAVSLFFLVRGAGPFSVDHWVFGRGQEHEPPARRDAREHREAHA